MLATLSVNLSSDGAVPVNDGNLTLREAIAYVNGTSPVGFLDAQRINGTLGTNDQIQFVSGLSGSTITLTVGQLQIKRPVAILGNVLNIVGAGTVFDIDVVGGPVGTVQISGLNMSSSGTDVNISALSEAQSALISGNTFSGGAYGVRSSDGIFSQLQVSGNTFKTSYGVYIDGNQFTSHPGLLGMPVLINNNLFEDEFNSGVYIANVSPLSTASPLLQISYNYFFGNGSSNPSVDAAIRFLFVNASFQIDNNVIGFDSLTVGGGNSAGIRILGSVTDDLSAIALNTINASTYDGIFIGSSNLPNLYIFSNYIGVNSSVTLGFPNGGTGIRVSGSTVYKIGGTASGNYIDTNVGSGIELDSYSNVSIIEYNEMKQNGGDGVILTTGAKAATIDRNNITHNVGAGIRLSNSAGNGTSILQNYFSQNGGIAIELETSSGSGPNPNDAGDADAGPNHLLNYAELVTSSVDASGNWTLTYDLDADKAGAYRVEFFRYTAATKTHTPIANGTQTVFAFDTPVVNSAGSGKQRFQYVASAIFGLAAGDVIVTSLTGVTGGNAGDSSEFSTLIPLTLVNGPPRVVDVRVDNLTLNSGVITRNWVRDPFSYASVVPTGKQLAPLYTQGANAIQIQFSEHVNVNMNSLKLYGTGPRGLGQPGSPSAPLDSVLTPVSPLSVNGFYYNATTHVATWVFPSLAVDKYRIVIADTGISDSSGNLLDGEWLNADGPIANGMVTTHTPDDFLDDQTNRMFLTGNGQAGGSFTLFFSYLPGDYNQDGSVKTNDLASLADGNGDGQVDSSGDGSTFLTPLYNQKLTMQRGMGDYNTSEAAGSKSTSRTT